MRLMRVTNWCGVLAVALMSLAAHCVQARIVTIDLDLPIDQVAPGTQGIKIGDHHRARIFYDTDKVDPKTHLVKPLHMQHLVRGLWIPQRLDPQSMPMDEAWLHVGVNSYTYHYHSVTGGSSVDFDDKARRMMIRRISDGSVVVSAPYIVDATPVEDPELFTLTAPPPKFTMLEVDVHLEQIGGSNSNSLKIGDIDKVRVIYDASLLNPRNHHVRLVNFQHLVRGNYLPAHVDPVAMPVNDAWLDLSREPYRIHFHAAVTHGVPILIDVSESSGRLTLHPQADPNAVMLAGPYEVHTEPHTGAEVDAAAMPALPAAATPAPPPSPAPK